MPLFVSVFTPPAPVAGLTATASGVGVELAWDPSTLSALDFVAYSVQRSDDAGPFVVLATIPNQATTTFVDYRAPLARQLVYRVTVVSIDGESEPADAATSIDACEFWLVAASGSLLGFELPNVTDYASAWPKQQTEHEPVGRSTKLVESGELLAEEGSIAALLLPDQMAVLAQLRTAAATAVGGRLLLKTPYGDVFAVVLGSIAAETKTGLRRSVSFRFVSTDAADV